jgi:hypothetical protein
MNMKDMIEALHQGSKIGNVNWSSSYYIYLQGTEIRSCNDFLGHDRTINTEEFTRQLVDPHLENRWFVWTREPTRYGLVGLGGNITSGTSKDLCLLLTDRQDPRKIYPNKEVRIMIANPPKPPYGVKLDPEVVKSDEFGLVRLTVTLPREAAGEMFIYAEGVNP